MPAKAAKPTGGYAKTVAAGKKPFFVPLTPEQYDQLRAVADAERRTMTQTLLYHGFGQIEKIFQKISK